MKWSLTITLIILSVPFIFACNCNGIANWGDLKNRVENVSDAVLTATISKVQNKTSYLEVTYQIKEVIKGKLKKKVIVVRYDLASDCAVDESWFVTGDEKLITTHRSKNTGLWEANNCDAFMTNNTQNARTYRAYTTHLRSLCAATAEK